MDSRLDNKDHTSPQVTRQEKIELDRGRSARTTRAPTSNRGKAKLETLTHERRGQSVSVRIDGALLTTPRRTRTSPAPGSRQLAVQRSGEARSTATNHRQLASAAEDDREQEQAHDSSGLRRSWGDLEDGGGGEVRKNLGSKQD